jgi:sensor domain CHASE-containing protein
MSELPLWPPFVALALAIVGYIFFWLWSRRLDREEQRQKRNAAE